MLHRSGVLKNPTGVYGAERARNSNAGFLSIQDANGLSAAVTASWGNGGSGNPVKLFATPHVNHGKMKGGIQLFKGGGPLAQDLHANPLLCS